MSKRKITDKNLYELFDILSSASEKEIKKAYRTKALKCHPDKNPDNPKAAELFHELSEALEILTDPKAREAYDKTLLAKERVKERSKELNAKRRKLKEDLERREKEGKKSNIIYKDGGYKAVSDEQKLQFEIERLRKEGSKALQEEQEFIKQQILKEKKSSSTSIPSQFNTSKISSSQINANNDINNKKSSSSNNSSSFAEFEAMVLKNLAAAAEAQKKAKLDETTNS